MYVRSKKELKPHPYLPFNTIYTEDNETLFRVNHASMARQLSEMSDQKDFKFHLTSLNPLNPKNKAGEFELRALKFIEENNETEYYEFNPYHFRYLGAILTEQKCIECHVNYKVGDIRGGLSVTLDSKNYNDAISEIENRSSVLKIGVFLFLFFITFLMTRQIQSNQTLVTQVQKRTKQISETKNLLQNVLDADLSLMIVSSGTEIILANKTALEFLEVASLDEFKLNHTHISDLFEPMNDEDYLQTTINGEHWIDYLQREQTRKLLKVMIHKNGENTHLKVHAKEINVNDQVIHIIIFDDITDELRTIENLKNQATRDPMTKLFNRGKFNEVLDQEIALSRSTSLPLSLIFLDIDHFKDVNDTYGHDVGDEVLIQLAKLLLETVRLGDFTARWGGEEFVVTLQATTAAQAAIVAEKIRQKVENHDFGTASEQRISLGVTQYRENESKEDFTKRVDEALYEAKETGRNKFVVR